MKWLYLMDSVSCTLIRDEVFRMSCNRSNLDISKWMYETIPSIDIHSKNDYVFKKVCRQCANRQCTIEFVKWLYSLDTHVYNCDVIYDISMKELFDTFSKERVPNRSFVL